MKNFSGGARSVQQLVSRIIEYGILEVSAQTRLDILTKIRDNAGNNYFRAWLENVSAMDITREWLKTGASASADNQVLETVMPLLHVCFLCLYSLVSCLIIFLAFISLLAVMPLNEPARFVTITQIADRLPFTGETLVSSKIGKIVRKLAKDAPIPGECSLFSSSRILRVWCQMFLHLFVWVAIHAPVIILRLTFVINAPRNGRVMSDCAAQSYHAFHSGQGHGSESRAEVAESIRLHAGSGHAR
jgi:protein phosphatase 1 regulatory subunit 10